MVEFLLAEIGRRPTSDRFTKDREGYSLAAGMALGLVTLARGRRSTHVRTAAEEKWAGTASGGGTQTVGSNGSIGSWVDLDATTDPHVGDGAPGLADLQLENRLLRYILGGKDDDSLHGAGGADPTFSQVYVICYYIFPVKIYLYGFQCIFSVYILVDNIQQI
jgi:hypothetical protein